MALILANVPTGGREQLMKHGGTNPAPFRTFMHEAACLEGSDASEKVQLLLNHGVSRMGFDVHGHLPIDLAIMAGNVASVNLLVNFHQQSEKGEKIWNRLYSMAATSKAKNQQSALEILKIFLDLQNDPNLIFSHDLDPLEIRNRNALMGAAEEGYPDRVDLILRHPKQDPNKRHPNKKYSALDLVLDKIGYVQVFPPDIQQKLPSIDDYRKIARMIIADPRFDPNNFVPEYFNDPMPYLHNAVALCEPEIVNLLLERKANIQVKDYEGMQPIDVADFHENFADAPEDRKKRYQEIKKMLSNHTSTIS